MTDSTLDTDLDDLRGPFRALCDKPVDRLQELQQHPELLAAAPDAREALQVLLRGAEGVSARRALAADR